MAQLLCVSACGLEKLAEWMIAVVSIESMGWSNCVVCGKQYQVCSLMRDGRVM